MPWGKSLASDLPFYLAWIVLLVGSSVFLVGRAQESLLFVAGLQVQLGFLTLVWPIWLARSLRSHERPADALLHAVLQAASLILLALPQIFVAQSLGHFAFGRVASGLGSLSSTALLVAAIVASGRAFRFNLSPSYYLGLFLTQAGLPLLAYFGAEFGAGWSPDLARILNPFWSSLPDSERSPFAQPAVFLAISGILTAAILLRRPSPVAPLQS